jgi:hypothetical protein
MFLSSYRNPSSSTGSKDSLSLMQQSMSLILVLSASDMEWPVLADAGFSEATVCVEMIQETPMCCSGIGGKARPLTVAFTLLILVWKKCPWSFGKLYSEHSFVFQWFWKSLNLYHGINPFIDVCCTSQGVVICLMSGSILYPNHIASCFENF